MTNLQRLVAYAQASKTFSKKELENFAAFFLFADDQDLSPVVTVLERHPGLARALYQNLVAKQQAARAEDKNAWDKILEDEIKTISSGSL